MTRSFIAVLGVGALLGIFTGPGCKASGVGDPCTPEREYEKNFSGFDQTQVSLESKSYQCQTRVCLVNHFQGRVSCPYGQDADGAGPGGTEGCFTPGSTKKDEADRITGIEGGRNDKTVPPQCADRTADKAVYCSCRCANVNGDTDDGANYCTCPEGFSCEQLIASIGALDTGLTGGYCVKQGTKYESGSCATHCDPTTAPCP